MLCYVIIYTLVARDILACTILYYTYTYTHHCCVGFYHLCSLFLGPLITTVTFALTCETPSRYCVEYSNGTLHDVLTFEFIALISVVVAIGGYLSASFIRRQEQEQQQPNEGEEEFGDDTTLLEHNENGVST